MSRVDTAKIPRGGIGLNRQIPPLQPQETGRQWTSSFEPIQLVRIILGAQPSTQIFYFARDLVLHIIPINEYRSRH